MDGLQILIWIFCAVISVSTSTNSHLNKQYIDVWTKYRGFQDEMMMFKTEVDFEFKRLALRTFTRLDRREIKRLETGFSSRYRTWMSMMRSEIGTLMIEEYPAPCSKTLLRILNEVEGRLTEEDLEIGVAIDRIKQCMSNPQNCTSSLELDVLRTEVLRLKEEWSQYRRNQFVQTWRQAVHCYHYLSMAVENKLIGLSDYAKKCENLTYEQFLEEIGLIPMSIHELVGPAIDWFKVEELQGLPSTIDIEYREKSELMQIVHSSQHTMMEYVTVHIVPEMDSVIDSSIVDLEEILTSILNQQNVAKDYQSCYHENMRNVLEATKNYYESYLEEACFYGLVTARNEFLKIVQCDLRRFEEILSKIHNCWANEEICTKISSRLKGFERSMRLWRQFSLEPAMNGARDCYNEANHLIYSYILKSIDRLKGCQFTSIPHIYYNLTKNIQPYPLYDMSHSCYLELKDMGF